MTSTAGSSAFGRLGYGIVILTVGLLGGTGVLAVPPHPSLLEAREAAKAVGADMPMLPDLDDMRARGIDAPEDCFGLRKGGDNLLHGECRRKFRVLAILVDFSDHEARTDATFFDTLLFGMRTGTVNGYFDEISYGKIDLVTLNLPSSRGWMRARQSYAYYAGWDYGLGQYPANALGLVEDVVDAVDSVVDFSKYDNDGDGDVDLLVVIHSGTGAELSGSIHDIWSHKWAISPRLTGDGVYVSSYTIQPEFWSRPGDMTCGVFSHEILHGFGLPELYDSDYSSQGIGRWGVMAGGAWNGVIGDSPAHPCAWSLIQLGIAKVRNITENRLDQEIRPVYDRGTIFRLWTSGTTSHEYFLVENRQQLGYDSALPGEGLLIWHIDDDKPDNQQEWYPGRPSDQHYLVALEQADGQYELEHFTSFGDAADSWPGSMDRTDFDGLSSPSSDGYETGGSFVAVRNITVDGEIIRADMLVDGVTTIDESGTATPEEFSLRQNYPNPFNPVTSIEFSLTEGSEVKLEVLNPLGQRVRILIDGYVGPGSTRTVWDATDQNGDKVASGTYLYRLTVNDRETTNKMMLLK